MDHSGQKPGSAAGMPLRLCGGDDDAAGRARLQLVTGTLVLSLGTEAAPQEWQQALDAVIAAHRIAVRRVEQERLPGLSQMRRWASGTAAGPAPLLAPWRCVSAAGFQGSPPQLPLPRAQWAASYLFDVGPHRPVASRAVDLVLMSPHPDQCAPDEDCAAALPRRSVLAAMIRAAREEGRSALAIIVPARCRGAMARHLLAADRTLTRGDVTLEIVAIEEAVGRLMGGAPEWDAIIAMPELRSIVLAILAQTCGLTGPWPMLWHDRGLSLVTAETLGDAPPRTPLDATLLMQALALAARKAGLGYEAQRVHESWARLRERGVVTGGRGADLPYVTIVDEGAFIDLALADTADRSRPVPPWKAIAGSAGNHARPVPVSLSLVASR